jgi:hypothetical protein
MPGAEKLESWNALHPKFSQQELLIFKITF